MADAPLVAVILDAARAYDRLIISGIAQFVQDTTAASRGGPTWSLYVEEDPLQKLPDLANWHGQGIIANFDDRRVATALAGIDIPVVGVGGGSGWYDPASGIPYIYTDNVAIGRLGAQHLLGCGLPTLAFYGYPRGRTTGWSDERAEAFRATAKAAGRPCHVFTGRQGDARRWESLQKELTLWLDGLPKPVGIMACNDLRARHVLEACRRLGLSVPADVAVLGVDNDQLVCELTRPPLSSIDQSARRIGYEAAALLSRMMTAGERPRKRRTALPQKVVVPPIGAVTRASTDTLASDDDAVVAMLQSIRVSPWRKPSIAAVAEARGISPTALEHRFQAAVGRSIHMEFMRQRMQRLRGMVVGTDLPLKTIAARTGFPSLQYMTTFFRRHTGTTPARLRAMERTRLMKGHRDA
ncbi:MAG: XylR family transcriptional regulator [Planctomycetia bacterium]